MVILGPNGESQLSSLRHRASILVARSDCIGPEALLLKSNGVQDIPGEQSAVKKYVVALLTLPICNISTGVYILLGEPGYALLAFLISIWLTVIFLTVVAVHDIFSFIDRKLEHRSMRKHGIIPPNSKGLPHKKPG